MNKAIAIFLSMFNFAVMGAFAFGCMYLFVGLVKFLEVCHK